MKPVILDIPFTDTRADQLRLSLEGSDEIAVCSQQIDLLCGVNLNLAILGASHQIDVRLGDRFFTEAVACRVRQGRVLPQRMNTDDYLFRHHIIRYSDRDSFAACTRQIQETFAAAPYGIVAVFGADESALTAVAANKLGRRPGITWTTRHCYPQTLEVITTRSDWRPR